MDTLAPEELLHYVRIVRELKELAGGNSPWVPLWSTIAGALLAYIPLAVGGWWRARKATQAVQAALIAEISYMVGIIELRGYLKGLISTHKELEADNLRDRKFHQDNNTFFSEHTETTLITIPEDYNKIYKAHLEKIGVLPAKVATDIVTFYGLIDAVVQDLRPEGVLRNEGYAEQYQEAIQLMHAALKIASKLTK